MLRQVNLDEISDGRIYNSYDMVKADCNGCEGCFACCKGMGKSITLDPYDIYNLTVKLNKTFEELVSELIELSISDGIILPNLKMAGTNEVCSFLSSEGRCTIHNFRPGICRLFPLGRYFENHTVHYILQIHECQHPNRSDIKVKKWIGISDISIYEKFVSEWHYFLKKLKTLISTNNDHAKAINMFLLKTFYLNPYDNDDFFVQFKERLRISENALSIN
jgi:Fe-S-cluster containining protein